MVEFAPFLMVVLIVAIVAYSKTQRLRLQHGVAEPGEARLEAERLREEVRALRDRVCVLERIVTDGDRARGLDLEREIEALRDAREDRR